LRADRAVPAGLRWTRRPRRTRRTRMSPSESVDPVDPVGPVSPVDPVDLGDPVASSESGRVQWIRRAEWTRRISARPAVQRIQRSACRSYRTFQV